MAFSIQDEDEEKRSLFGVVDDLDRVKKVETSKKHLLIPPGSDTNQIIRLFDKERARILAMAPMVKDWLKFSDDECMFAPYFSDILTGMFKQAFGNTFKINIDLFAKNRLWKVNETGHHDVIPSLFKNDYQIDPDNRWGISTNILKQNTEFLNNQLDNGVKIRSDIIYHWGQSTGPYITSDESPKVFFDKIDQAIMEASEGNISNYKRDVPEIVLMVAKHFGLEVVWKKALFKTFMVFALMDPGQFFDIKDVEIKKIIMCEAARMAMISEVFLAMPKLAETSKVEAFLKVQKRSNFRPYWQNYQNLKRLQAFMKA